MIRSHSGRLTSYSGNYRAYARLRQERYEQQLREWESQQEYVAKQEEYIRRVHYGQLHKQAQSRQKVLDKIERLERPVLVESPHMHFGEVRRSGDVVIQWNQAVLSAIRNDRPSLGFLTRDLAIVQTAIYDAVNAIDHTGSVFRVHAEAPAEASPVAVPDPLTPSVTVTQAVALS